jgi:hypothetical protein
MDEYTGKDEKKKCGKTMGAGLLTHAIACAKQEKREKP